MGNLETRLQRLGEWRQTVKHMRGMHDQRKHNRYPPGYQAEVYVPHPRESSSISGRNLVGDSLAMWRRDNGAVGLQDNRPFAITSGLLMNRVTNYDTASESMPTGKELADRMLRDEPRPNNILLAKYLMERGYLVTDKESLHSITNFWGTGAGYFYNFPSPSGEKLTQQQLEKKTVQWQRAYIAALQKYTTDAKGNPVQTTDLPAAYKKAIDYANHIEHITKPNSPYDMARNMIALQLLRNQFKGRNLQGAPGDIGQHEFIMRKLLAVPAKLWEKYKPGTPITDIPFINELFTTTEFGNNANLEKNGSMIMSAMTRGKTSIFAYVQDKFPEMTTHLVDVLNQAKLGFEITPIPSALLASVTNGDNKTAPQFAPASATEFDVKPVQQPGTAPKQVDAASGEFVRDSLTGLLVPRSVVQLSEAIDPGNVLVTSAKNSERGTVNSLNIENIMDTARSLAQSTGLPIEIITSFMSYWQHGSQTIGQYPAPMLIRMQQAAAELFGLQLGDNGQQLNAYQEFLMKEALRLTQGSQQWSSGSTDRFMRTYAENLHLFQDFFERNYHTWTDHDEMNPIQTSDRPKTLAPYMSRPESEWNNWRASQRKPLPPFTDEERADMKKQIADFYKQNDMVPQSVEYVPGTPYRTAQDARKALLKTIYDRTQELLAASGVKKATLYRSVSLTKEHLDAIQEDVRQRTGNQKFTVYNSDGSFNPSSLAEVDIRLPRNAMESWSYDFETANLFGASIDSGTPIFDRSRVPAGKEPKGRTILAELTLSTDVDASRIISTPATGFGNYTEGEIVITGNKDDSVRVASAHARKHKDADLPYNDWVDKKADEIFLTLEERMKLIDSYYRYTGYGAREEHFDQNRIMYILRRAGLIQEADELKIHR